jgi:hypothetical protein
LADEKIKRREKRKGEGREGGRQMCASGARQPPQVKVPI